MIYKIIFLVSLISFKTSFTFCQVAPKHDSLQILKKGTNAKDSSILIKDNNKAHAVLNTNMGTASPETTSGTMNSTVNPNSQVIIPFGHKKKKSVITSNSAESPKNQ